MIEYKSLVVNLLSHIFDSEKNFLYKGIKAEAKQLFSNGIREYLNKQVERYVYVKTFLHRHKPIYFYDTYQPLSLVKHDEGEIIKSDSVNRVFWESQFILVSGAAGSGKSTLVKHLFLNCIKEKFGIPILVEFRSLGNHGGAFEEYIFDKILRENLAVDRKILKRLLEQGKFVFFLDGYDEIASNHRKELVEDINQFISSNIKNRFFLTSRPHTHATSLPLFHNYKILPLSTEEAVEFVAKQAIENNLKEGLKAAIKSANQDYVNQFLGNPLLLTLYVLTFSRNPRLPKTRSTYYRRVIDTLFAEHDSVTKLGYEREFLSGLSQEEFEGVLKPFSFISYCNSKFLFSKDYVSGLIKKINKRLEIRNFQINSIIADLKISLSLWQQDANDLYFVHRSIQEYFTALFITNLPKKNKKQAYEKIGGIKTPRNSEVKNLLNLCEELDQINFLQHYLIPSLKHFNERVNLQWQEKKLIQQMINFFFKEVGFADASGEDKEIIQEFVFFGSIYPPFEVRLNYPYLGKEVEELGEMLATEIGNFVSSREINKYDFVDTGHKISFKQFEGFEHPEFGEKVPLYSLDITEEIPTELIRRLKKVRFKEKFTELILSNHERIIEAEDFIRKSESQGGDILDLLD